MKKNIISNVVMSLISITVIGSGSFVFAQDPYSEGETGFPDHWLLSTLINEENNLGKTDGTSIQGETQSKPEFERPELDDMDAYSAGETDFANHVLLSTIIGRNNF